MADRITEHGLTLRDGRRIHRDAVRYEMSTSGGPGGQHANRTASRVVARLQLDQLPLSEAEMERVKRRLANRTAADGTISTSAASNRSQLRNRNEATERLIDLVDRALKPPVPRVATKPSRGAKERRLEAKRHVAGKKAGRRSTGADD